MNPRIEKVCRLMKEIAYTEGFHNLGIPLFDERTNMITWEGNVIDRKVADVRIIGRPYGVVASIKDGCIKEGTEVDWCIFCGDNTRTGRLYLPSQSSAAPISSSLRGT